LEFFLHTIIQGVGGVIFEIIFTLSSCNPSFGTTWFVRFEEKELESAGGQFESFICFGTSIFFFKSVGMAAYLPWNLSFLIIPNGLIL